MTLLEIIRKKKVATATVATVATVTPAFAPSVAKVASVAVATQEDIKFEARVNKVLNILAEKPGSQRAIIADLDSDPDNVILTIALRDQYTFEMLVAKDKYDAFLLLELIEKMRTH